MLECHVESLLARIALGGKDKQNGKAAGVPLLSLIRYAPPRKKDGKRVCILRPGGIGDVLFLGPSVKRLADEGYEVGLCIHPGIAPLVKGMPGLSSVQAYPPPKAQLETWDRIINLDGGIEGNPIAEKENAYKVMGDWCGVKVPRKEWRPYVADIQGLNQFGAEWHKPKGETWVLVQLKASSGLRSWPLEHSGELLRHLSQRKDVHRIFVAAARGQFRGFTQGVVHNGVEFKMPARVPKVTDLTGMLSIPDMVRVIRECDLVIGPDSSMYHIAEGLGIPGISLHGSFPAEIRTAGYKYNVSLVGEAECAPCWTHHTGCPLGHKECKALAAIEPKEVLEAVDKVLTLRRGT